MKGNNLVKVKRQNETLIKDVIYRYGPISRLEISEILSLTPPTITTNISAMIERGIVYECVGLEDETHTLGRPPIKLDFVEDIFFVIGVEINPYQTTICMLNIRGKEKISLCYISKELEYIEEINYLSNKILELIEKSGVEHNKILGVGVGIPGFVERNRGVLRKGTLRKWREQNISYDLSRRLDLPVILDNNAKARAVGEELFSKEPRPDIFSYYLISYGIACPFYMRDMDFDKEQIGVGEAGHMVAILNGPKCETCGNYGCLEEVASERAIIKNIKKEIENGRKTMITEICDKLENLDIKEVIMAQECGDELANEIIQKAIMYLGATLANIINFFNPPLVLVDGYIMKVKKNRRQFLREVRKHIFGLYDEEVEVEFIEFDSLIGARGAAAMAIKKYFIRG